MSTLITAGSFGNVGYLLCKTGHTSTTGINSQAFTTANYTSAASLWSAAVKYTTTCAMLSYPRKSLNETYLEACAEGIFDTLFSTVDGYGQTKIRILKLRLSTAPRCKCNRYRRLRFA